jgi:phenol 2-monooxygenase (NADPH)
MSSTATSKVDVLIIGAGPAGLMLALWMSRLGVKARIVDKRTAKVYSGQADGYVEGQSADRDQARALNRCSFQVRTLEILDSFGV